MRIQAGSRNGVAATCSRTIMQGLGCYLEQKPDAGCAVLRGTVQRSVSILALYPNLHST